MPTDRETYKQLQQHKEWLGLLQPVGLVVSPLALQEAQVVLDRNVVELQEILKGVVADNDEGVGIANFATFAVEVLGWESEDLVSTEKLPSEIAVPLPEYGEVLKPTYAVPDPDSGHWLMLVQVLPEGSAMDEADSQAESSGRWTASPEAKFERLLRETNIAVGLLCNGSALRLVYAPKGESSGYLTFPIAPLCEVSGRPILSAMEMLLGANRVFSAPENRRLNDLLVASRKHQAEVSTKLAEQVLDALWQLLRGFQAAEEASNGKVLRELAQTEPQQIYGGLITVLMRLVFLLYAEDEGLMPQDSIYTRNYSVTGLYERLREDAGNYPDTMNQRYGAWAWLLSLFRLVYEGGCHGNFYLPARHGELFDPQHYPFLEGRHHPSPDSATEIPRLSDEVIFRVLQGLLIVDGERLSYRALDVEDIGSVYQATMGFSLEQAQGPSVALRPKDIVIDINKILAAKSSDRAQLLKEAECKVTGKALSQIKAAKTPEDILAALERKISPRTSDILPVGSLYLQPGEERRRSGSHYTPRQLTKPIVEKTLEPLFAQFGDSATPEQILSLKICDPAMGSGAFLVETCRQLAEKLVESWGKHGLLTPSTTSAENTNPPTRQTLPPDVEPLTHARRLVAQRCIYGVDKNPFAVSLAKLSLWLITLSKDYPFTFIDHALKYGDSLVGLTRAEIGQFVEESKANDIYSLPLLSLLTEGVDRAKAYRDQINLLGDRDDDEKRDRFQQAEKELAEARLAGNLAIAAFFAADTAKECQEKREEFADKLREWRNRDTANPELAAIGSTLQQFEKPVAPFNWDIEFPEVFDRTPSGFDGIVGNPPFMGKNTAINSHAPGYIDWLKTIHPESHGNADLVAHFFRRSFNLLRPQGCLGLIATNTIAQGDTRSTGLRYLCQNGGRIYHAQKRLKWPGLAAVVVSVVHLQKIGVATAKAGKTPFPKNAGNTRFILDGREVPMISAFLFHAGGNENPARLLANANKSFIGSYVLGMGFTFDDSNPDATPISQMHHLIEKDPKNGDRIFPYIGGEEVNSSPTHSHHRYVINFGEMSEAEAWEYTNLMKILEEKVKPQRVKDKRASYRKYWWQYAEKRVDLFKAISDCERVLVVSRLGQQCSFTFLKSNTVLSERLVVFATPKYSFFAVMQSRIHEIWVRFFGSSMKDDLLYTPSDCFETFPFPENWESDPKLEGIGRTYYEYRAELMVRNNEGLTDTYNRFHNPDERHPDIVKLRQLHEQMDRAVLDAYGWTDIQPTCEFLLDYEEEEEDETSSRRKKPWRYRWSEEIHNEVLARLLDLNQQRHQQEILGGKHSQSKAKSKTGGKKKTRKSGKKVPDEQPALFDMDNV